jgi:hypothetical protein
MSTRGVQVGKNNYIDFDEFNTTMVEEVGPQSNGEQITDIANFVVTTVKSAFSRVLNILEREKR